MPGGSGDESHAAQLPERPVCFLNWCMYRIPRFGFHIEGNWLCVWLSLLIWWSFLYMGLIPTHLRHGCTPCVREMPTKILIWPRASQDAQGLFSVEGSPEVAKRWKRWLCPSLLAPYGGLAWDCQEAWHQHNLVAGLWHGSCTGTAHEAHFVKEPTFNLFKS